MVKINNRNPSGDSADGFLLERVQCSLSHSNHEGLLCQRFTAGQHAKIMPIVLVDLSDKKI